MPSTPLTEGNVKGGRKATAKMLERETEDIKNTQQQNFELKMKIFYLEEKLSKLTAHGPVSISNPSSSSSPPTHPPSEDVSELLEGYEFEIKGLKGKIERMEEENKQLSDKLSKTEDELLSLSDTLDSTSHSTSALKSQLTLALESNARLVEENRDIKAKGERRKVEEAINEQTSELLNSYRMHNEKLTVENGGLAKEVEELREANGDMKKVIKSLRSELSTIASLSPEDTGPEISSAIKAQLDSYQAKSTNDAKTIEDCVAKITELTCSLTEAKRENGRIRGEMDNVKGELKSTKVELDTARRFPSGISGEGKDGVREILETQGEMASELAKKELEIESLKEACKGAMGRAKMAEDGARRITEQMNLIKTTSEEVAMLEAEEIARLEGELDICNGKLASERKDRVEQENAYERKIERIAEEAEDAKGELLKVKRLNNAAEEKLQRMTNEMESMRGYTQDVANRLHSVQFSGHVKDIRKQSAYESATNNNTFLNGYLTGIPSQSFRPVATTGTTAVADSLISLPDPPSNLESRGPDYTSELELLYIQREKELLDKLADTMTKIRVYEDDGGKAQSPQEKKKRRWRNPPPVVEVTEETKETAPVSPRSPKRSSKPGLHQPTASSLAKNEVQILKKKKYDQKLLKKGGGKGGGKLQPGRVNYPKTGAAFYDVVVDVVDRNRAAKDASEGQVPEVANIGTTFTNYYDAALTPIPFDKQLRMASPIPPPTTTSTQAKPLQPTPTLTPSQNPFTTMSALAQSFLSARTPLDDLRDKLTSGSL